MRRQTTSHTLTPYICWKGQEMDTFMPFLSQAMRKKVRTYATCEEVLIGHEYGLRMTANQFRKVRKSRGASRVIFESKTELKVPGEESVNRAIVRFAEEKVLEEIDISLEHFPLKDGDLWLETIRKTLSTWLRVPVVLHGCESSARTPIEDDSFHIWHNSTPEKGKEMRMLPKRIFGQKLSRRKRERSAFSTTTQGRIISDLAGFEMAELVGERNLYIHYSIGSHEQSVRMSVLQSILGRVLELLYLSEEQRSHLLELRLAERSEKTLEDYRPFVLKRDEDALKKLKQKEREERERLEELQKQRLELLRSLAATEEELLLIEAQPPEKRHQRLFNELTEIANDHRVDGDPWIEGEEIVFLTHPIICNCDVEGYAGKYKMGRYQIRISMTEAPAGYSSLSGMSEGTKWFALDYQVDAYYDSMHHPEIQSSGSACLGTYKAPLMELWGKCQWSDMAFLTLEYVENVSIIGDAWGKRILDWNQIEDTDEVKS